MTLLLPTCPRGPNFIPPALPGQTRATPLRSRASRRRAPPPARPPRAPRPFGARRPPRGALPRMRGARCRRCGGRPRRAGSAHSFTSTTARQTWGKETTRRLPAVAIASSLGRRGENSARRAWRCASAHIFTPTAAVTTRLEPRDRRLVLARVLRVECLCTRKLALEPRDRVARACGLERGLVGVAPRGVARARLGGELGMTVALSGEQSEGHLLALHTASLEFTLAASAE